MANEKRYINIPTVGEFLYDEFMEPLGLSQNTLANAIGVPQNRISEIVNGKRGITADTDLRLCKFFRMSDGFFSRIQIGFERTLARRKLEKALSEIVPFANDNDDDSDKLLEM
jgi:addiction module HigA family antidote